METSTDGKLEYWPRAGSAANIGIMLFRTTAIELAKVRPATPPSSSSPLCFQLLPACGSRPAVLCTKTYSSETCQSGLPFTRPLAYAPTAQDGAELHQQTPLLWVKRDGGGVRQEWNKLLESDSKIWDQNAFNDLFRRGLRFNESRGDNLIEYGPAFLPFVLSSPPLHLIVSGPRTLSFALLSSPLHLIESDPRTLPLSCSTLLCIA
jgi:hypothetical protein